MADKNESSSETRKKHKKKHKKSAKTSNEEQESTVVESPDTINASPAKPEHSPIAQESKSSPAKMAPKPKKQWSYEQQEKLLQNIKKYTLKLSGKEQYSERVNWSMVEPVDDFTQPEMQKEYQSLTKKVRKRRSVSEILVDAMSIHKEVKTLPIRKKKVKQPPTAFGIFCKTKRASLIEKYPELKFVEVHKKLCERWKATPEEKREKYVVKAEKAKLEFYEELRKIHDQEISQIKKPKSAYDMWKSERLQDEDLEGDESDFLAEWENLPKSTKKGWIQAATGDMMRYNLEVERLTNKTNGSALLKSDTKRKNHKAAETEVKDKFTSDEQQHQSPSSVSNSGLKRKTDSSKQAAKSPARKVTKKESSSSDSSEESSDED